jgi:hypothetical protein
MENISWNVHVRITKSYRQGLPYTQHNEEVRLDWSHLTWDLPYKTRNRSNDKGREYDEKYVRKY